VWNGTAGWCGTSAEAAWDPGEDTVPMSGGRETGDPEEFVALARMARAVELRTLEWFRRRRLGPGNG
jgi:hypothetical protein